MRIEQEEKETKGRFVAFDGNQEAGEVTYSLANDGQLLIADHTGVDESYKGQGVGKTLYEHLVDHARGTGKKIMPLCPFIKSMFEKNKDDWDVLRNNSL